MVPLQANTDKGLDQLKQAIADSAGPVRRCPAGADISARLLRTKSPASRRCSATGAACYLLRRLLLDVGGAIETLLVGKHGNAPRRRRCRRPGSGSPRRTVGMPAVEARTRYGWIRTGHGRLHRAARAQRPVSWTDRLDRVLTHKVWGTLIFLAAHVSRLPVDLLLGPPADGYHRRRQGLLADWSPTLMSPGPLRSLLVEGMIKGVGSVADVSCRRS